MTPTLYVIEVRTGPRKWEPSYMCHTQQAAKNWIAASKH